MIGLLLIAGCAHLGPLWQSYSDALRAGDHFALVRVVSATDTKGGTWRTAIELVEPVAGQPPKRATVEQAGAPQHAFTIGQFVLMPLSKQAGKWRYVARTRRAMLVERRNRRPAIAFARRWRARPAATLEASIDHWIDLVGHSTAVARRLALHALLGQADHVDALMTDQRLDRLAAPLATPGLPDAEAQNRVRLLGALGGRAGSRRIAAYFDRLSSDRVRRVAVGVLARYPGEKALATLERCATDASGSLKMRCLRSVQRLRGPTP